MRPIHAVPTTMSLVAQSERTETRFNRENESTFAYLNLSARAPMTAAREVFEQWFAAYPDSGKADLRARFRSPIDAQHQSAFWELYLHELFSRLGFTLEPHPDVEGSSNHPDFLVKAGDEAKFYLEGIVAGLPSVKDAGSEARLAEVLDSSIRCRYPNGFFRLNIAVPQRHHRQSRSCVSNRSLGWRRWT